MGSNAVFVRHDVSVRRLLELEHRDNILISRMDFLRSCYDMLLRRLDKAASIGTLTASIHVRTNLLDMDYSADRYLNYLHSGAKVTLWANQDEIVPLQPEVGLKVIQTAKSNPIENESFLVIQMANLSRILAIWQDEESWIKGVLVTNAQAVDDVVLELNNLLVQYK